MKYFLLLPFISFLLSASEPVSLKILSNPIEVKEGTQTNVSVIGTYADGSTKEILENVEWIIKDNSIVSISDNTLNGLSEGVTTIQAKFNNITSTPVTVVVYKEINGYKLPPEPDPVVNNSTLLGIDFNNNGVRDDVEIYVIKRFAKDPEFPKTKTALAMQYAWSAQKILKNPTIDSKKYSDDAIDCQFYWINNKRKNMSTLDGIKYSQKHKVFNDPEIKDKIYNTRERIEQKFSYNAALSGNILTQEEDTLDKCQVNIDELGE